MDYLYCEYLLSSAVVSGIRLNQVRSLFHLSPLLDLSWYYESYFPIYRQQALCLQCQEGLQISSGVRW